MLRSVTIKSNLVRNTLKKSFRANLLRTISTELSKYNYDKQFLVTNHRKWHETQCLKRLYSSSLPVHTKVLLPALSPTMESGTIISWEKKEGDRLNEGDLLAEIETDKATMGFETPEEGFLAKIVVPAGTKDVAIGKLVCIIVENQGDVAAFKDFKDDGKTVAAAPPAPSAPEAAPPLPAPSAPPVPTPVSIPSGIAERAHASPMAKRLAEQRNIRLQGKGTGLFGSITSADLEKSTSAAPAAATAASPPGASFVDVSVSSMRSTIAKRLMQSKQNIPHYYLSVEVNVDKLLQIRETFNKKLQKQGIKLSINDFIIKAIAMASKKVPEANAVWMDEQKIIRQYLNVDVSVAVSTDKGLITPIVFSAQTKGVVEISQIVKELAKKARENKLQPQEFQGGTISVSNLGMYGINQFCAIVNPPQSVILAVGSTVKKLQLDESPRGFKESNILMVSLSCDHRVVDGAIGAQWLSAFREFMEEPAAMIL